MTRSIFTDTRVHLGYIYCSVGGRVKTRAARSEYLDDAAIRKLKPKEKAYSVFDDEIRGFFVRVLPSATKSYGVRVKRTGAKKSYFYTLGETSSHSNEYAREWAKQTRDAVKDNRDPRRESITKNTGITFREAFDLCKAHKLKRGNWSAGTAAKYERQFERHVPSRLKKQLLKEVDYTHLSDIHDSLAGTPAEGNRLRSMLKVLFAYAERKGWRPIGSNVADRLEPHAEIAKSMPNGAGYALADSEYAAVMAYLDQAIQRRKFLLARTANPRQACLPWYQRLGLGVSRSSGQPQGVGHAYQTLQEAQAFAHRQQHTLSVLTDGMRCCLADMDATMTNLAHMLDRF